MPGVPKFGMAALVLILPLLSCANDPRTIRLADVDLSNLAVVEKLRRSLSIEERAALTDYVVRHRVQSAAFCGTRLVDDGGGDPQTLGDAIDLTIARKLEEERRDAQKPGWALRWEELTRERDRLMDRQSLLLVKHGPAAHRMVGGPRCKRNWLRTTKH
jgi:hypothetical protein